MLSAPTIIDSTSETIDRRIKLKVPRHIYVRSSIHFCHQNLYILTLDRYIIQIKKKVTTGLSSQITIFISIQIFLSNPKIILRKPCDESKYKKNKKFHFSLLIDIIPVLYDRASRILCVTRI